MCFFYLKIAQLSKKPRKVKILSKRVPWPFSNQQNDLFPHISFSEGETKLLAIFGLPYKRTGKVGQGCPFCGLGGGEEFFFPIHIFTLSNGKAMLRD